MTIIGPECVIVILICVYIPALLTSLCYTRNHGSHFEKHKAAFEEGGGADTAFIDDDTTPPSGRTGALRDEEKAEEERSSIGVGEKS